MTDSVHVLIHFLSIILFFIAWILTLKLWTRLKDEKYWIGVVFAIFFFFLHELFEFLNEFELLASPLDLLPEIMEFSGSISMIYFALGLERILSNVNSIMKEK